MKKLTLTVSILAFGVGVGAAQAFPVAEIDKVAAQLSAEESASVILVGQKTYKPKGYYKKKRQRARNGSVNQFKGNGRVVKDTCPGGDHGCIKDLKANCDKAGGGLSTEPDGGVDCFVVGIHDQPDQSD